jgi:hypothetical protein
MAFPWMMVAQMGLGAVQSIVSASKASDLPEPQKFTTSPEKTQAFNEAKARRNQGHSLAATKAFEQILARQATANKQMFRNMGMSGAGAAASNIMSVDAMNEFAARGAQLEQANFAQYLGAAEGMQQERNMETQRQNQRLMAEEQALGGGIQAGISNIFQGLNTGQNVGYMNKALDVYQGMGAGGSTSPMFGGFGSNLIGNRQRTGFSQASLMNPSQPAQPNQFWSGFGSNIMGNQQQTGFNTPSGNFYGFQ